LTYIFDGCYNKNPPFERIGGKKTRLCLDKVKVFGFLSKRTKIILTKNKMRDILSELRKKSSKPSAERQEEGP